MRRTIALLIAIVFCSGCEGEPRIPTLSTPLPTTPPDPPSGPPSLAAAQIGGRVIEADFENPIPGAHVTTADVCYEDRCGPADQPYSTVADEQGYFRLTANLPQGWRSLTLKVANPGLEPTQLTVRPDSAVFAVIKAYRLITIRPGESVQLRVLHFHDTCGMDGIPCRRMSVEAPADEPINLEVFPAQTEDVFGVMVGPFPFSLPPLQTRLTVRRGAAWIVRYPAFMSGTGMVTVVARSGSAR
jgi:hypothetical protein